jgi:hypothetical protein
MKREKRLVALLHLVSLVYPVSLVQPNKRDKPNKPDEPDKPQTKRVDFFSILLESWAKVSTEGVLTG